MTDTVDMEMYEGHPGPGQAYADAPGLDEEGQALAQAAAELGPARPAWLAPPAPSERREVLLRQAALADRLALAAPHDMLAGRTAAHTGFLLLKFDLSHPDEWDGGEGPSSPLWDGEGGTRAYTRSQYAQWHLAWFEPDAGPTGEPCSGSVECPCEWHDWNRPV